MDGTSCKLSFDCDSWGGRTIAGGKLCWITRQKTLVRKNFTGSVVVDGSSVWCNEGELEGKGFRALASIEEKCEVMRLAQKAVCGEEKWSKSWTSYGRVGWYINTYPQCVTACPFTMWTINGTRCTRYTSNEYDINAYPSGVAGCGVVSNGAPTLFMSIDALEIDGRSTVEHNSTTIHCVHPMEQ